MAVDLRLENFAKHVFMHYRQKMNEGQDESDLTDDIRNMLKLRACFFGIELITDLERNFKFFVNNVIEFYFYLCSHMNKYFPYLKMCIFDKMIISLVVVKAMSLICETHKNITKLMFPLSWAMYFDTECKDLFYADGGWVKLKEYAEKAYTANYFSSKRPYDGKVLSDLDYIKEIYYTADSIYCFNSNIVDTFNRRKGDKFESLSCSFCFPLFDVLDSICYKENIKNMKADNFQLTEGYFQILMKMPTKNTFKKILRIAKNTYKNYEFNAVEEENYFDGKLASSFTKVLHDGIFSCKNRDSSVTTETNKNCKLCIFCGKDLKTAVIYPPSQAGASEKVTLLKLKIREKVSSLECAEKADSSVRKDGSYDRSSYKINKNLRLFLALGVESISSTVKDNIKNEFEFNADTF